MHENKSAFRSVNMDAYLKLCAGKKMDTMSMTCSPGQKSDERRREWKIDARVHAAKDRDLKARSLYRGQFGDSGRTSRVLGGEATERHDGIEQRTPGYNERMPKCGSKATSGVDATTSEGIRGLGVPGASLLPPIQKVGGDACMACCERVHSRQVNSALGEGRIGEGRMTAFRTFEAQTDGKVCLEGRHGGTVASGLLEKKMTPECSNRMLKGVEQATATHPLHASSWSKDPSTTDSAEIPPESRNLRLVFSNKRNSHQSPEVNVTVKGLLLKCPARLIAELNYSFSGKKINPSLSGIEKKTTCFRPHLDVGEWVCPPAGCQMGWWACPWWAYPLHGKGCGIVGMPTDGGHAHGGYAHLADKIVGMPTIGWWACPRMVGMPTDGGHARGEYAHLADRMVGMPTLSGLFSCSSFRQRFYMMVHQAALGLCREDMVILR
ncbi:hypothetical protein FB45DRAFT_871415 [Roridomyces roridus]|uniref:Uncharacterized protein n=1 Tax=Roridomyces roridus TaxID=1738132 RepID=A0AAD7BGG8_9AGAR|nr:hypothetical protein FB45DRAFT_871415 [Roridomyces roridus]